MTDILKQLPLLLLGLAVLATVTILGYFGHVSSADTLTVLLSLSFLTGGLSLVVLANPQTLNATLAVHVTFALALVGAVLALALHNVFDSQQVQNFLAPLIGTGLLAAPANNAGNAPAVAVGSDSTLRAIADAVGQILHVVKPPTAG